MRVALLADIHGNLPALKAVLNDAAQKQIKTFWCLGDVVGYGPWPVQCWATLKTLNIASDAWVVGNHDLGLVDGLEGGQYFNGEYFNNEAKVVLDYHRQACQHYQQIFKQVKQIQTIVEPRPGVVLAHGVPKPLDKTWTVTKYTANKIDAEQAISDLSQAGLTPKLIAVGHSHKAIFWRRKAGDKDDQVQWQEETPDGEISLGDLADDIVYLNPGSVGQPRDGGAEARYCYLDWDTMTVTFCRVSYPVKMIQEKMFELGYPRTLIEKWYSDY